MNVPGYQHVDRLAEYLVELRHLTAQCLNQRQVDTIINLWESMDQRDKECVEYAARHQERLLTGRYRVPKRPSVTPGVESTIRCMLGASSAPAQWPDCCRLVESIFIRLCTLYPSPMKKGKGSCSRWVLILKDYHKIRELVVCNPRLMDPEKTKMQLVEVNQTTLTAWHNGRKKDQELSVRLQGTTVLPAISEAQEPLPEAQAQPAEYGPAPAHQEHHYRLPENTAGQAVQRRHTPRAIMPKELATRQLFVTPPAPLAPPAPLGPAALPAASAPTMFASRTPEGQTVYQIVFPAPQQGTNTQPAAATSGAVGVGATLKRPYRRTVQANTCQRCGLFRTAETGHSQYRGRVYCPRSDAPLTREQWLENMKLRFPKL